jgi:hypothetical protein
MVGKKASISFKDITCDEAWVLRACNRGQAAFVLLENLSSP